MLKTVPIEVAHLPQPTHHPQERRLGKGSKRTLVHVPYDHRALARGPRRWHDDHGKSDEMYRTTFRFGSKKEVDSCDTRSAGWSCGARTSRQPRGRPKSWGTRVRTKFRSLRGLLSPHLSHKRSSLSRRYQAFGYMDDHHLKFT